MKIYDPAALAAKFEGLAHARRHKQKGLDPEQIYSLTVPDGEGDIVEHALTTTDLEDAAALLRMYSSAQLRALDDFEPPLTP